VEAVAAVMAIQTGMVRFVKPRRAARASWP